MRYCGVHRAWVVLALASAAGCANRPTKPLVLTEQVGELPVQFASPHCQIPLLSAPPAQPYEVIARVKTYGNPGTDMAEMQTALHHEACAIGAQAVSFPPVETSEIWGPTIRTDPCHSPTT